MANLQVKNLPEDLHQRLRQYARSQQRTISEIAQAAIEREMARFEWKERWSKRPALFEAPLLTADEPLSRAAAKAGISIQYCQ